MKKLLIVVFLGLAAPSILFAADFSGTLDALKNKYTFNDDVFTVLPTEDTLYVGGEFTSIYQDIGLGLLVSQSTDERDTAFARIKGSSINTAISDGAGGWYVGGSLSSVDSDGVSELVHIAADGTLDTDFSPTFVGEIFALALSSDGGTLYVGGDFESVNGNDSDYTLVALDTTTGLVTISGSVFNTEAVRALALSTNDATLYVGGEFTTAGEDADPRNGMAAFSTEDGSLTLFDPNLEAESDSGLVPGAAYVIDISESENILYVGGGFIQVNGDTPRRDFAAFDLNGDVTDLDIGLNNNVGETVYALAESADGGTLYVGGDFKQVNTDTNQPDLGAFDTTTGDSTGFSAGFTDLPTTVQALALSDDEGMLYVGGDFTFGDNNTKYFIKVDADTGAPSELDLALFSNDSGAVKVLVPSGAGDVFVGGSFDGADEVIRQGVAAIDLSDYSITDFDPGLSDPFESGITVGAHTMVLSQDGGTLYVGGEFTTVNYDEDSERSSLAAFNTDDGGSATSFNPELYRDGNPPTISALTLSPNDGVLYIGGYFTDVNDEAASRNDLAAVTTDDGLVVPDFIPDPDDRIFALDLSEDGTTLYAGGNFTTVNGGAENRDEIAAFDTATGDATPFDPGDLTGSPVYVVGLSEDEQTLYVGGGFTAVGGTERINFAALDLTGTLKDLNLNLVEPEDDTTVRAIAESPFGDQVYVGGDFIAVNTDTLRNGIGVFDAETGIAEDFDPDLVMTGGKYVYAIGRSGDGSELYLGGSFSHALGSRLAIFSGDADTGPVVPQDEEEETGGGSSSGSRTSSGSSALVLLLIQLRDLLQQYVALLLSGQV